MMSPPLSAKNTMYSPIPAGASPMRFSQAPSPIPGPSNQMAMFQPGQCFESPAPVRPSPYPTPSSQSTMDPPPNTDPAQWAQFQDFLRNQQMQHFQQPPTNMPLPSILPQNQLYAQQPLSRDSGYGSGTYDNLGQAHGLPVQQPQGYATRPGHTYGKVVAKGNARVIRGNAHDSTRPLMNERQHQYNEAEVGDQADMFDGDVTTEQMREFYLRR